MIVPCADEPDVVGGRMTDLERALHEVAQLRRGRVAERRWRRVGGQDVDQAGAPLVTVVVQPGREARARAP